MIRILKNEDKQMMLEYIKKYSVETTFLYGNVINFPIENDKSIRRCADYYGYFENDELKGIIPFYNLGSCIPHYESKNAISEFVELLKERNFKFLIGMKKIVQPLYELIVPFKKEKEYKDSSYFMLKNFKPYKLSNANIEFLNADANNIDMLKFMNSARNIGFGDNITLEERKKSLLQRGNEEEVIILSADGKMAATACVQTSTDTLNQIGGVVTIPEERGKGYCKAVVSKMCEIIINRGKQATLMVVNSNTPAVKAYKSLGFEYYDDYVFIEY